jgi:putative intracellular protease/amidase
MFLAPDNVYYSEYIVAYEGLKALGYTVELVSATDEDVTPYMLPSGTTIEETANTLPGNNKFNAFKSQFESLFDAEWNHSLNSVPISISNIQSIHSIESLSNYAGIVIAGGTGILNFRADGVYETQAGISANDIQLTAQKLNSLASQALKSGKPILAQCHGASLPVFWKVEGSETPLMFGQSATGYPEASTQSIYQNQGVELRAEDKVVVSSPSSSLVNFAEGDYKIVTSRDWYPQTVAHATKVFANILETFPNVSHRHSQKKVLLLHGGATDELNCSPANRDNDIPCNYGGGVDLPADYTHVKELIQSNHIDEYQFVVTDINIANPTLPYTTTNQASIEAYLATFDAIIFFKHWSTGVTTALQNALVAYAENGGGILAMHHAFYNDIDDGNASLNKNILTTQLFGATSEEGNWSALRENYQMFSTNYGHFISTFKVPTSTIQEAPPNWAENPMIGIANRSLSVYPVINIFDEVYNNKGFVTSTSFGTEVNQITPLFSNNLSGGQAHTEGYVRLFNNNGDSKMGRIACFQAGESRSSFNLSHPFAQVIRNSVIWLTLK